MAKYANKVARNKGFDNLDQVIGITLPEVDLGEALFDLETQFSTELSARDLCIRMLEEESSLREDIKRINSSLTELREEEKSLRRIHDTADMAVQKAFNENPKLRAQSIWMRENNRAAEWDSAIETQKVKSIKTLVGENVYIRYNQVRAMIQSKMTEINDLDQKAIAIHVQAETVKANGGFKTKAVK